MKLIPAFIFNCSPTRWSTSRFLFSCHVTASSRGTFPTLPLDLSKPFQPVHSVPQPRRGECSLNLLLSAKPCRCAVVLASDSPSVTLRENLTLKAVFRLQRYQICIIRLILFVNPSRGNTQLHPMQESKLRPTMDVRTREF